MLSEMDQKGCLFQARTRRTLKLRFPSPNIVKPVSMNNFVNYKTVLKLNKHLLKDKDKLIIKVLELQKKAYFNCKTV